MVDFVIAIAHDVFCFISQELQMGFEATGFFDGAYGYKIFIWGIWGQELLMGLMGTGSSEGV